MRGGRAHTPGTPIGNGDGERHIATGRGGFGNITEEQRERDSLEEEKEEERRRYEDGIVARHRAEEGDRP